MHNSSAHHQLTDAQPAPKKQAAMPQITPPSFILHFAIWYGVSFWPAGSAVPAVSPYWLPMHPSLLVNTMMWETEKSLT